MLTVIRNFLAVGAGEVVGRLVAFAAYLYLVRVLGPEYYGVVAFAAGVTLYLAKFADFGIEAVGSDEIARDADSIRQLAGPVLAARLAVALFVVLLAAIPVWFFMPEPDRLVLLLYLLTLIPVSMSTKWIYMGIEKATPVGVWRVIGDLIFGGLAVTLVKGPDDLWVVPLALVAGEAVGAAALFLRLKTQGLGVRLRWDPEVAAPILRRAAPIMGQILLGLLLYNMDVVFLRVLMGNEAVGYYAAAYMLISFLANIGVLYGLSLLPALSRESEAEAGQTSFESTTAIYHTALAHVFAITAPVAVGGVFVARGIIELGFGDAYQPSVIVLQVLVWVVPITVLRNVPWSALIARDAEHLAMRATLWAVVLNLVLNATLIPKIGMVGAALATLLAEPLACGMMIYYAATRGLPMMPLRRLVKPVLAAAAMAAALWWVAADGLVLPLVVGATTYLVTLAVLGGLGREGRIPVLRI